MDLQQNQLAFLESCEEARRLALSFKDPLVVHHHDADGVSAGAIVVGALTEAGKNPRTKCVKKLDDGAISELESAKEDEIIFVDLGGGNPKVDGLRDIVIIDHHQTEGITKMQANPMLHGIEGSDELSASGAAYCVFRSGADLAIVGAVGDIQSPMRSMNRWVLEQGEKEGRVRIDIDLRFYGRYCRPLVQFLAYSDDPYIPLISYNEERAEGLLSSLGIKLRDGDRLRVYADLDEAEKKGLISEIANILASSSSLKKAGEMIGESYVFPERPKNETYEANEFSTLLNACGRHGRPDIGLRVCLGDESAYGQARELLTVHRRMIREGIGFASAKVQDLGPFRFLDARGAVDESIIGTVCGMALRATWAKPIIGISDGGAGTIKVSSRAPRALVAAGLNLAQVMKAGVEASGGIGGGHRIAAGASIPAEKINEFLLAVGGELRQKT
jgi:single-stranded-DNA-specific exonuclease